MNKRDKSTSAEHPSESDEPEKPEKPEKPENPENPPSTETEKTAGNDYTALLDAHKGKLAVGVAATLGLLIYYNLKKKTLPEEDPEGYARLQKLKDQLRFANGKKSEPKPPKPSAKQPAGIGRTEEATDAENFSENSPERRPDSNSK